MRYRDILEGSSKVYRAVLLHGTPETFTKFDFDKITSMGPYGVGVYLSNDYGLAKTYSDGGEPMQVEVILVKPYHLDLDSADRSLRAPFRSRQGKEKLLSEGYDGVVVTEGDYVEVCAYAGAHLTIIE